MKAVIYELKAHNVSDDDIEIIMSRVKNRLTDKNIDKELERLGYDKIFTVDYDEFDDMYDEDEDFYDYDNTGFSKSQKKRSFDD